MGRILGIDYGHVRIGLALTDSLKIIASAYKTLKVKSIKESISDIIEEIKENDVEKIILGLPMGLNGEKTEKTKEVERFYEKLKSKTDLEIIFFDESFSSARAHKIMHQMGKKTGHNKEMVDMIAASVVLQDYLQTI